jgi:sulfoxide reductase heme-binding subunit YedZ
MTSPPVWYLNRATGIVSLVLMTLTIVLGVLVRRQQRLPGLPRFGVLALHRNVSLISASLLVVHIVTAVVDSYVSVPWISVVLPFTTNWRPQAQALGALAVDLMLLVIGTSLVRSRIPLRLWRGIHWTSYALWPLAFLHGITAGTDLASGGPLVVALACAGVVGASAAAAWIGRSTRPAQRARAAVGDSRSALSSGQPAAVFRNR